MKTNRIEEILGNPGTMVGTSKGRYRYNNPENVVVFNSNICTKDNGKIWYGDIDLTVDLSKVVETAKYLKKDLYVLYEMDGRFENEEKPKYDDAVAIITSKGELKLKNSEYYEIKDGIPFFKKHKTSEVEFVPTPIEYNKEDFKAFKFPDIKTFKGTNKASPIDKLQSFLIDSYGKEKAQEMYLNLHWTKENEDEFNGLLETYCTKVLKIDGYETQKAISWATLDLPLRFYGTPTWVKPGYIYQRIIKE